VANPPSLPPQCLYCRRSRIDHVSLAEVGIRATSSTSLPSKKQETPDEARPIGGDELGEVGLPAADPFVIPEVCTGSARVVHSRPDQHI
jgi:hypothetical protein